MKKFEIYSLCVKIVLFLDIYTELKKDELLYLISLSDFYNNDTMQSDNIKNINSLSYYTRQINESVAILLATRIIVFYGSDFHLSATGQVLANEIRNNKINENLIKKVIYVSKNYNCKSNLDSVYNELVKKFILKNIGDRNEN